MNLRTAIGTSLCSRFHARLLAVIVLAPFALPVLAQQGFNQPPPSHPQPMQQGGHGQAGYPQGGGTPMGQPGYPQGGGMQGGQGGYPQGGGMQGGQGGYPQGGGMQGGQGGYPQGGMQGGQVHPMVQAELQDYGIPPSQQLQANTHGPTPTSIPGGQVVTTDRLLAMYQQAQNGGGLLVFDVLGSGQTLPMAQNALGAAQPGTFNDQTQQQFGQYLQQVTQGNKAVPMVFYCRNTQCWMSYNAALRAIHLGYTQVYWYRGGIDAWQQVAQAAMAGQNQGGQPQYPQGGQYQPAGGQHPGQYR